MALFFGKQLCKILAIFVNINNYMFWRGDKAMLYSAVARQGILISAGMEQANILRFVVHKFG